MVELKPGLVADLDVQAQVEEWLQEHMDGDKAASTQKAYQAAWEKWCDWSRRQKWLTPYLDQADPLENENKLLGYMGYMGWLGTSVASLKQAVFAIKDARKRAGHGGRHREDAPLVDHPELPGPFSAKEAPTSWGHHSHAEMGEPAVCRGTGDGRPGEGGLSRDDSSTAHSLVFHAQSPWVL